MGKVFLDTSFLVALEDKRDQDHQSAQNYWNQAKGSVTPVTTSYICDETVTLFYKRNLHEKAVEIGERLIHSPDMDFLHIDEEVFREGWEYFKRHQDKDYSLTDCISFVVMKKKRIQRVITFDVHFQQAGFEILPKQR